MPRLTLEQARSLAPDAASLQAAQGLAEARHWASLGGSDLALWGECKGSAKEPYKVRFDLADHGSACTCPSRKYPCKHILGLLLLAAASPARLTQTAPPGWVAEWLDKRAARHAPAAKAPEAKAGPAERQKDAARRAARREKLAESGIDALERWLKDFAGRGLAFAQSAPPAFWDEQAARLVDAQLPGAARLIREMASVSGADPNRAQALLLRLARLYLLAQAYRKLETLPEATQQDVRALLGWNVNQDELLAASPGVVDDWLTLASRTEEDEKTGLRTQVNWLWGKASRRPALLLNYAFRNQPLDASLIPGLALHGELVFFAGAYPLRAIFKHKQVTPAAFIPSGFPTLAAFLDEYAAALGQNPWLEVFPALLEGATPLNLEQHWLLCDARSQALPLSPSFSSPWELLALSGGRPLTVFGLWDGFTLAPLAAWGDGRFVEVGGNEG